MFKFYPEDIVVNLKSASIIPEASFAVRVTQIYYDVIKRCILFDGIVISSKCKEFINEQPVFDLDYNLFRRVFYANKSQIFNVGDIVKYYSKLNDKTLFVEVTKTNNDVLFSGKVIFCENVENCWIGYESDCWMDHNFIKVKYFPIQF